MNESDTAAAARANLDPAKAANDLANLLEGRNVTPLTPRGASLVRPLPDEPEVEGGTCRDCGSPTGRKNSKVCAECRESKAARRKQPKADQPQAEQESAMPRGVYERKSRKNKAEGGAADTPKQKRKYTRREKSANGADDPKSLATEALLAAGAHLYATVLEQVEVGDNPDLKAALRQFEVAQKISKAVG